ncbi:Ser/Thr protein phosphatase family protein [Rhodopirellula maiorica SM1]|uniref:Ser/Thr protein phosphatase family protein n=1 Tax=Rhodopirellula maiorica SM1 TaxID=1265738 RepID=M5RSZ7_9BACT|nr:metallophosphoesterase family protein [Rhodopirellula maiorica]EMI18517.1 Ser/Thr protein phosphatase family protein [Rhodopirellula maiorica SM1]
MKYLCFSDLHCDKSAAEKLVTMSEDVDIVIGAGDFANQHRGISDTLDILAAIRKPSVIVPGNGETVEELKQAAASWETATVLHGDGCELAGVPFWGVGGGIPVTPFGDWSYDFDEDQAAAMLKGCPEGGVLVVHSPPINSVDHDTGGRVRGSQTIRDVVEARKPDLVVCGHIHSDWGKQVRIGSSLVLNAGPSGVVIEIP